MTFSHEDRIEWKTYTREYIVRRYIYKAMLRVGVDGFFHEDEGILARE